MIEIKNMMLSYFYLMSTIMRAPVVGATSQRMKVWFAHVNTCPSAQSVTRYAVIVWACRITHLPLLLECNMFNFDTAGSSTTVIDGGKC